MPKPSLPPEALIDLRHRLSTLPSRSATRRQVIQEVATVYAVSELAARFGASVERETTSSGEATRLAPTG